MIEDEIKRLHEELPEGVELVAVSKFHPVEAIRRAYDAGQRLFGESRVQELAVKRCQLPSDIQWHFIGHLQTNKVKVLLENVSMIESVDSERLLRVIDEESFKLGKVTNLLLEVHVAREETKTGFTPEELLRFFSDRKFETLKATHICGLMGMASNTDDVNRIRADFSQICSLFRLIRDNEELGLRGFDRLSMGMSGDWPIAVEEGANIVRVGSAIFGNRF